MTFADRLRAARLAGDLSVADLAAWFDRPYPTVWQWLHYRQRDPSVNHESAMTALCLLEQAIAMQLLPLHGAAGRLRARRDSLKGVFDHAREHGGVSTHNPPG